MRIRFPAFLSLLLWLAALGGGSARADGVALGADQLREALRASQIRFYRDPDGGLASECVCSLYVPLSQIAPHVVNALVATEDRWFRYNLLGVEPIGLTQAFFRRYLLGEKRVPGASTITMQLIKNRLLHSGVDSSRKWAEIVFAPELKLNLSEDEILEFYLNAAYFGHLEGRPLYGIEHAARNYYRKRARDLTLYESAQLIGMLKGPANYHPVARPEAARERAITVLHAMLRDGFIQDRQAIEALHRGSQPGDEDEVWWEHRHFADWALHEVKRLVPAGIDLTALKLVVTFDANAQRQAERAMQRQVALAAGHDIGNGALVATDSNGAVRAMMGGMSYAVRQINLATQDRRQAASVFKPIVYLAALEAGYDPRQKILDGPLKIGSWAPVNPTGFHGKVTLETALARSLNSATVRLGEEVGRARYIAVARRLGLSGDLPDVPSLALGTNQVSLLEMAGVYGAFANGGFKVEPYGIIGILNREGEALYWRDPGRGRRVIEPYHLALLDGMLRAAVKRDGTGHSAAFGSVPIAGKTGTSSANRDAWFVGYRKQLVTAVWVGNYDRSPMRKMSGGAVPAKIFAQFNANLDPVEPEQPKARQLLTMAELRRDGRSAGLEPRPN